MNIQQITSAALLIIAPAVYAQTPTTAPARADATACPIDLRKEADKYVKLHSLKRVQEIYSKIDSALSDKDRQFLYDCARKSFLEGAVQTKIDTKGDGSAKETEIYHRSIKNSDAALRDANLRIQSIVEKLGVLKPGSPLGEYTDPVTGLAIKLRIEPNALWKGSPNSPASFNPKLPLMVMSVEYGAKKDGDLSEVSVTNSGVHANFRNPTDDRGDTENSIMSLAQALYFQAGDQYPACRDLVNNRQVTAEENKIAASAINNAPSAKTVIPADGDAATEHAPVKSVTGSAQQ
jgi:hypothetical protein